MYSSLLELVPESKLAPEENHWMNKLWRTVFTYSFSFVKAKASPLASEILLLSADVGKSELHERSDATSTFRVFLQTQHVPLNTPLDTRCLLSDQNDTLQVKFALYGHCLFANATYDQPLVLLSSTSTQQHDETKDVVNTKENT
jgi:hypothetical protein